MLDVAKAFDHIWLNGLFYKLSSIGLNGKTWRLLKESYNQFKCCVCIGGMTSDEFTILQGLHQGGPFSMMGFELFNDELLKILTASTEGLEINNLCLTSPAFADDLTVMALSKKALQNLMDKIFEFSHKWRIEFNPTKCHVIIYGKDKQPGTNVYFGNKAISISNAHTHVGTLVSNNKTEIRQYILQRISSCKRLGHAITAIGSHRAPVTPQSASHVYWTVCIPKLTYGLELMDLPDQSLRDMESYHAEIAKCIQGLPDQTCNIAAVAMLGWLSIQGYLDILMLSLLWKIISLPLAYIYKQLFLIRYVTHTYRDQENHYGPLWRAMNRSEKYGLLPFIIDAVETGEYMPDTQWKRLCKERVWQREQKQWKVNSALFVKLSEIRQMIDCKNVLSWWQYAQHNTEDMNKCKLILKLFLGVHNLKCNAVKYTGENQSQLCTNCSDYKYETIEHVLFECEGNSVLRGHLWNNILESCPSASMVYEMTSMSTKARCSFLLSGLNNSYVKEWNNLFKAIVQFITAMYNTHQQ